MNKKAFLGKILILVFLLGVTFAFYLIYKINPNTELIRNSPQEDSYENKISSGSTSEDTNTNSKTNSSNTNQTNSTSCTDTDGGISYFVKGTATNNAGSSVDLCNSATNLTEYYCFSDQIRSTYYNCQNGYTCTNGACGSSGSNETNQTCTNECTSGQMRCSGSYSQACGNYDVDSCTEWNAGTLCQYGCSGAGVCGSAPTPFCTDSDGGQNYYLKGIVNTEQCNYTDYCGIGNFTSNVIENYCIDASGSKIAYTCPYGCDDGKCKFAPRKPPRICKTAFCRNFIRGGTVSS